jgi:hypothetical protein
MFVWIVLLDGFMCYCFGNTAAPMRMSDALYVQLVLGCDSYFIKKGVEGLHLLAALGADKTWNKTTHCTDLFRSDNIPKHII